MRISQYYSVTRFITKLNENENIMNENYIVSAFFEGSEAFKNQFGICIKPIFISIKTESKPISIHYDRIQKIFEGQPLISFKENNDRYLPSSKTKKDMFKLDIYMKKKEFKGISYYPSSMDRCNENSETVTKIRKHVADCKQTDLSDFTDL